MTVGIRGILLFKVVRYLSFLEKLLLFGFVLQWLWSIKLEVEFAVVKVYHILLISFIIYILVFYPLQIYIIIQLMHKKRKNKEDPFPLKAKKPIHIFKKLNKFKLQATDPNGDQCYLISTIDCFLFIIKNDIVDGLKYISPPIPMPSPVCQAYFDERQSIYLGLFSGDIEILDIKQYKLKETKYYEPSNSQFCPIQLIYRRGSLLFAFNLQNKLLVFNAHTLQPNYCLQFKKTFTAAISILNPLTMNITGCISFNNKYPPILFDCDSKQDFLKILDHQNSLHASEKNNIEGQITQIVYEHTYTGQNYVVCGVKDADNYYIFLMKVEWSNKDKGQTYCVRKFGFQLQSQLKHLSVFDNFLCFSTDQNIIIVSLEGEIKRLLSLPRKDKKIFWAFITRREKDNFEFIICKGFDYQQKTEMLDRPTNLHLVSKIINHNKY